MAGFKGEKFVHVVHCKGTATGGSGTSYDDALPIAHGDLWSIPADTVIEKVWVVIDTLLTGTTDLDIGDDDDPDGFVDGSLSVTVGTAGAYSLNAKVAGAYLR